MVSPLRPDRHPRDGSVVGVSRESRTAIAVAAFRAMFEEMTPAEQADVVRWVNATYADAHDRKPDLTDRETRVLRLHARGLGARAISEIVHCSYTTVPRDLRAMQAKLGAHSPHHLIVVAARAGLL